MKRTLGKRFYQTHFGFASVDEKEKHKLVGQVFHRVASSYDVMNDVMSGGIHRLWKQRLVECVDPFPQIRHLDVAGGTGDVAFLCYEALRHRIADRQRQTFPLHQQEQSSITVLDINPSMLAVGRSRAEQRGYTNDQSMINLDFVAGDAQFLPFASETFDSYTIAFGLRNVTNIEIALKEAHRVLKPGGRFMCLEFSKVHNPVLGTCYDWYSFNVIPELGRLVAGDRDSYQYLVESIRQFPEQKDLSDMMKGVGFGNVWYENQSAGICAIHSGLVL